MQFDEDSVVSADYLKKAVPLMVQRQIPTNPLNYALWYTHVKSAIPELSERLLFEFPSAGTYNPEKSEELFYEYIVKKAPDTDDTQGAVASLLTQLFSTVTKADEGTSQYSQSLKSTMEAIQDTDDPEVVQKALATLLKDTDSVNQLTQNFQAQLVTAREEVETLRQKLQVSEKSALLDELTQIGNRRAFDQAMEKSLSDDLLPTQLLLDLDHFKKCNDTYGHVTGDRILETVGGILAQLREEHIHPARYGGEEFAVICEQPAEKALELAETIRKKVAGIRMRQAGSDKVIDHITVSIGISEARFDDTAESLKERTDKALYAAKEGGRNKVVVS